MGTELWLVKDGKPLYKVPVEAIHEESERLQLDISEEKLERLAELYSIAANQQRLRMMLELANRGEMRFSDFLRLTSNPKLVNTCVEELSEAGLLEPRDKGDSYRPTDAGSAFVFTITAGVAKLFDALEDE